MFEEQELKLKVSSDLRGPRLWVRRLAIWEAPGGRKIRDISLRPGLNIIWSPDGFEDDDNPGERGIGHGGGKTLFCRFIRYCLGEQRFANEVQRDRILSAFPDGIVGAEVVLDGVVWAVVRSLSARRRHVAIAEGDLEKIAAGEGAATSLAPLIEAIERSIVTPIVARLARLQSGQKAWPIALAWLTRDQECRFNDVLDWRSPASGSDAPPPASGREVGPRRDALRAFLMAITEEEQEVQLAVEDLRSRIASVEKDISRLEWDLIRRRRRLIDDLGLGDQNQPEMPTLLEVFHKAADERLAAVARVPASDLVDLSQARKALQNTREKLRLVEDRKIRLEAQLPVEEKLLTLISSEIPGLSAAVENAASQVCPICEVPIDKVLADKCGLSHKLHDEAECRDRLASKRMEIEEQKQKLNNLKTDLKSLGPDMALRKQSVVASEVRVQALEKARDEGDSAWRAATRIKDDAERFREFSGEYDDLQKALRELEGKLTQDRNTLAAYRDAQDRTFAEITEKFSAIIRRLMRQNAKGSVKLSGHGLDIAVDVDGDRRTAAMESLKVLAFDLACLCLSIEGATHVPAFLIHDSPREADLGLSIYDELFYLMRELEVLTGEACFQYIITTTTRPPDAIRRLPWLRWTLKGAPGSERLMGCNL